MTDAELNARASADPAWWRRYVLGFMALCLRHYEEALRRQHAALEEQQRQHPDSVYYAYNNPWYYGGRDVMGNDPIFRDSAPPPYFGAVGDIRERTRLFNALTGPVRQAVAQSRAYRKLASLHRMMSFSYRDMTDAGRTPAEIIHAIYRHFHRYASGAVERAEMIAFALTSAFTNIAGATSCLGGARAPGPVGGAARRTPPEIGRGAEDIGHARTLPRPPGPIGRNVDSEAARASTMLPPAPAAPRADPAPRQQMAGQAEREIALADTLRGADPLARTERLIPQTRPGVSDEEPAVVPPRPASPAMTREGIDGANRNWEAARAPGTTRTPLTREEMISAATRLDGHTVVHMNAEGYAASWQLAGGSPPGAQPAFGFRVTGPDGSAILTVAFVADPRSLPLAPLE